MPQRTFAPGPRMSKLDGVVLILGAISTFALASVNGWIALAVAFVVAHFFLFCNVLRMSRRLELIWAAAFVALAIAAMIYGVLRWPIVFAISAAVTLFVTILEIRSPGYHGIAWQSLNPRLPEWWNTNSGEPETQSPSPL